MSIRLALARPARLSHVLVQSAACELGISGIFASAGVGLPWPTLLPLSLYPYLGVTIPITLGLWRFWPAVDRSGAVAAFGLWCSLALFVFGAIGCYAPIFALASFR